MARISYGNSGTNSSPGQIETLGFHHMIA